MFKHLIDNRRHRLLNFDWVNRIVEQQQIVISTMVKHSIEKQQILGGNRNPNYIRKLTGNAGGNGSA